MRVVVDAAVFDDAAVDALALLDVLACGAEGRHVVAIDPPLRTSSDARASFNRWLARTLAPDGAITRLLAEHYQRGPTRDDRVTLRREVRVVAEAYSTWGAEPPRLTVRDARQLLREPLSIVLEDAVNDGAFLLALTHVAGEGGRRLRERLDRAWLRVAHGGGIGTIPRLVRALDEAPTLRLRCHVLVDHDGDAPDAPSRHSKLVEDACAEAGVPFLRLRRRAIENYAPREALERWARGELFSRREVGDAKSWQRVLHNPGHPAMLAERETALTAWNDLTEPERCHAPLKAMLADDIAERVFAGYVAGKARPGADPEPERFVVQPAWLRRDGCAAEAEHLVESILRSA
ncbi:MAG: hypothetical protein U0324_30100 [Polyangiales bacterium]